MNAFVVPLCLCLLGAEPASSADAPRRPNFIVIYSDDHMYRAVGYTNPNKRQKVKARREGNPKEGGSGL